MSHKGKDKGVSKSFVDYDVRKWSKRRHFISFWDWPSLEYFPQEKQQTIIDVKRMETPFSDIHNSDVVLTWNYHRNGHVRLMYSKHATSKHHLKVQIHNH